MKTTAHLQTDLRISGATVSNFEPTKYYIDFQPQKLQQVAPENLYRQPKICYCFITDKITPLADTEVKF